MVIQVPLFQNLVSAHNVAHNAGNGLRSVQFTCIPAVTLHDLLFSVGNAVCLP